MAIVDLGLDLTHDQASRDWQLNAACRGLDTELFYPEADVRRHGTAIQTRYIARVCGDCDVADQCLEFALNHHETNGIWGGRNFTTREMRKFSAAWRIAQ